MQQILGVDIGGVIIGRTQVENAYPPLPGAFSALKNLREKRFGPNIFLVSHADFQLSQNMLNWFLGHRFTDQTGIPLYNVRFCKERKEKADICRSLGISHFIDDRTEVLEWLYKAGIRNLYLFQGREDEMIPRKHLLPYFIQMPSWLETEKALVGMTL